VSPDRPAARREQTRETNGDTPSLTIQVVAGVGFGPTKLAAFDAALREAGVADRNLVPLSSIIPVGARVVPTAGRGDAPGEWGDRLYVVMAQLRVDTRYEEAVAGLGWVQEAETGRGVFVEHIGHTEREVRRDILATLSALAEGRSGLQFGAPELMIRTTVCAGEPTCAVVAAVFEADPWRGDEVIDLTEPA
jgi:arginine decarboxylase